MAETASAPRFAEIDSLDPLEFDPLAQPTDEIVALARSVERGIRDDPLRFQRALDALGEAATSTDMESFLQLDLDDRDAGAAVLLLAYFSLRCDRRVAFDHATDEALSNDPAYRTALATHKNSRSQTISRGTMSHDLRTDPNAQPAREAVRRTTLAFYISRTIAWQGQQQQQLRAAS